MSDDTRLLLATLCGLAGLGWWFGVEVWRGMSQEHSARMFWLHLTAPLVAIAFAVAALWLLITTERLRRYREHGPNPTLQQTASSIASRVASP